jgi:uncharacterized protein YqhQ
MAAESAPRYVGGQAVLDGVMMRGEHVYAVAVRTPDGAIQVEVQDAPKWAQRWGKIPLARGVVALAESLVLGMRALAWSAQQSIADDDDIQLGKGSIALSMTLALVLFSGLFIVLPAVITRAAGHVFAHGVAFNVAEGLLRLTIFLSYLLLMGRLADVRRLFQYHGAEHKSIAAYENGVEVTPERAQRFTTQHVRCGTNFLLTVMVITIAVHALFGRPSWKVLLLTRVTLLPVIAALSYELIRYAARHMDKRVVQVLMRPGLALQRLTTREPTLDQLEVAITALRAALTAEELAEVDARTPDRVGVRIPGAAPLAPAPA